MKKFFSLVCCSIFIFTGCGKTSYFKTTDADEVINKQTDTEEIVVEERSSTIFVQVAGAVGAPGVYELQMDSRVYAAIDAAGGLLDTADDSDLNQAAILEDGQKIYVYTVEEKEAFEEEALTQTANDGLININTATVAELTSLPGIGEAKASQIIAYRDANGAFSSIDDIKKVSGIGDGIFNQINSLIKI